MLILQDTLNKVAVHSITRADDAKKKKEKVLRFTFILKYIFLSFKSTAILLSGNVLGWKGFKTNVAFPYVSGKRNTFYGNLSDCMNKPTFLDIEVFFSSCDILYKNTSKCVIRCD